MGVFHCQRHRITVHTAYIKANSSDLEEDKIEDIEECKIIMGNWFPEEVMDSCSFDISLKNGDQTWVTQFFDMESDDNIGNERVPISSLVYLV